MSKTLLTIPIISCSYNAPFLLFCFEVPHDLAEDRNRAKPAQWPGFTTHTFRSQCEPR